MAGLHETLNDSFTSLWNYLAYGLLYIMLQHLICIFFAHICKWSGVAALISGVIIGEITLGGGVTLHLENLPLWYQKLSPMEWVLSVLLPEIHSSEILNKLANCKAKQVQRQDIIVQAPCEPPDGAAALREIALNTVNNLTSIELGIGVGIIGLLIIIGFMLIRYTTIKRPRSAPNKP